MVERGWDFWKGANFAQLLRNFDFCVVNPDRPWKSANLGLWMQSELWVEVTEREFA